MPNGVAEIGESAFFGCGELREIKFSANLSSIGDFAFCRCRKLHAVVLPRGITRLGQSVFSECESIAKLVFPSGLTEIDASAFNGCCGLETVEIPADNPSFCIEDGVVYNKDKTEALIGLRSVRRYVAPLTVNVIGRGVFYRRSGLQSVVLRDNVKEISSMAFGRCDALESVEIPRGCVVENDAFVGCSGLTKIRLDGVKLRSYAFEKCKSLNQVVVSAETVIGYGAFGECESIAYNKFDNALYLGDESNPYARLIKCADRNACSCDISDAAIEISHTAFRNCKNIRELFIPDGVKTIGEMAFYKATRLQKLSLPASLRLVGASAFNATDGGLFIEYRGAKENWRSVVVETGSQTEDRTVAVKCLDGDTELVLKHKEDM